VNSHVPLRSCRVSSVCSGMVCKFFLHIKETVPRDGYFLEGLNVLTSTF
jgi:hypothetical protein